MVEISGFLIVPGQILRRCAPDVAQPLAVLTLMRQRHWKFNSAAETRGSDADCGFQRLALSGAALASTVSKRVLVMAANRAVGLD